MWFEFAGRCLHRAHRRRGVLAVCFAVALAFCGTLAGATDISPAAQKVVATIDALQVEQRWPAGQHVDWQTGIPDGKPEVRNGSHTHCSAFVAAAAQQLGVYLLRPPQHSQVLLANAQYDWLGGAGAQQGWQAIEGDLTAQQAANRGLLVVAVYRNHHDDKPGHIAIVRPSDKSDALIHDEGPQVTQAGSRNYRSTSLRQGFAGHAAAWNKHEVRYYAHAVMG